MINSTYCYIQLIIENIISWCTVFGTNYLFISYFAFFFFKFINLFVSDVVFLYLRDVEQKLCIYASSKKNFKTQKCQKVNNST